MNVTIDAGLKKKCPALALGCVTASVLTTDSPAELAAEMHASEDRILKLPDSRTLLDAPSISSTRTAYRALGKDPARYRGSAEALIRRIIAGKHYPKINCVVDVINFVSVESRLPVGLYDLAHVQGDILFRAGRAGETYKGIGKYDLNLEGLPVFCDAAGPHGSPTSDSERTMVTAQTTNVIAILISFGGPQPLQSWTQQLGELLKKHAESPEFESQVIL